MKNPFEKDQNIAIAAAIAIGAITVGTAVWLYLTDSGAEKRGQIKRKVKSKAKDAVSNVVSKKTKIPKKIVRAVADHVAD